MILDQDGAARKRLAQVLADGEPDDAAFEADLFSYVTNTASLELRANIESAMERSRSLCDWYTNTKKHLVRTPVLKGSKDFETFGNGLKSRGSLTLRLR